MVGGCVQQGQIWKAIFIWNPIKKLSTTFTVIEMSVWVWLAEWMEDGVMGCSLVKKLFFLAFLARFPNFGLYLFVCLFEYVLVYMFSISFLGQVWSHMRTFQLSRHNGGCLRQIRLLPIVLVAIHVSISG